jgi:hypothetical protein
MQDIIYDDLISHVDVLHHARILTVAIRAYILYSIV